MMPLSARRSFLALLSCASLLLTFSGCSSPQTSSSSAQTSDLGRLMVERLGWMDKVAQVKQARHLPVTDAKREAELLEAMVKQGAEHGVPARAVKDFFTGQMQAAKVYQEEWMKSHPHGVLGHDVPDLAKTVRPALDKISAQMITGLAHARASHDKIVIMNDAAGQLAKAGYSQSVAEPALRGLSSGLAQ